MQKSKALVTTSNLRIGISEKGGDATKLGGQICALVQVEKKSPHVQVFIKTI